MKKLFALLLVGAAGYGALWVWQSPYYALWQIDQGATARNAAQVERYVDLEALVRAAVEVTGALAQEELGITGDDLGSKVLGSLVGAVAQGVGEAASVQGAMELRRAIQQGRLTRALGAFEIQEGWRALGGLERREGRALVSINGTCHGVEAAVRAVFLQRDGETFGYPKKWQLVGVDADSVKLLAKVCRKRA